MLHLLITSPAPKSPFEAIGDFLQTWPLVGTVLLAVVPLYWPTFRWARQLKSDSDIYSKLPAGVERDRLGIETVTQTRRLLQYRDTIGRGKYLFRSALAVAYVAAFPITILISPESVFADGWYTIFLVLAPVGILALMVRNIWNGRTPYHGLDPTGVVIRERLDRRRRRYKRLYKLNRFRRRHDRNRSSSLGFRYPVDTLSMVATDRFDKAWSYAMLYGRAPREDRVFFPDTYRRAIAAVQREWESEVQRYQATEYLAPGRSGTSDSEENRAGPSDNM